jgi:5-methylcytosine-specific restriction endonuclease McrA
MNLSHLTDEMLNASNIAVAKEEREVLSKALHHLRETERRRLYSKYKCESLQDYAMKQMGYSDDQARRRINAMRLLKELPQIQEKIETGALNLTLLNQAGALFSQERKAQVTRTNEEKLELLTKIERQPKRAVEKTLVNESLLKPLLADVDSFTSLKPVDLEQFSPAMQKKIKRLLEVRAHKAKNVLDALEQAVDVALEKWDPMVKAEKKDSKANREKIDLTKKANNSAPARNCYGRYIPAALRREVYMRAGGKCSSCDSRRMLEIDHVIPFAKGGKTELSNLRLLCRSCNQRHAIESYGLGKMGNFAKEPIRLYCA